APAETLASLLRQHRRAYGITQEQLAERAGLSARSIQDLERGLSIPRRDSLDRLVVALGLQAEARRAFETAATRRPRRTPAASASGRRHVRNNLPRQVTSFVGREREIQELQQLLGTASLLTLTGAGGVGKTRLAIHLAESVLANFPDGVWLV